MNMDASTVGDTLQVNGTASKTTSGSWDANSDIRIKKDIQPLTGALSIISKLNPVMFHYVDAYKDAHNSVDSKDGTVRKNVDDYYYFNFIAQEYGKIFPDYVKNSGENISGVSKTR